MPTSSRIASSPRTADLERSENRLAAILNALPDLVFVVDDEGRYVEILTSREDLLYRAAEEMKGRRFHDILPAPVADAHLRLVQRTLETRTSQTLEYSLKVLAGERWFEGRTGLLGVRVDGHPAVAFIARDVTDRKRAEELESQNIYLQEEIKVERSYGEVVGESPAMRRVFKAIGMVADTESTVLVLGETGTGKELTARAIHNLSRRRHGVMVKVNCAALPSSLAESELFGHERGAFTGAVQQKKGRFELAHNGTIFLDEVGELSPDVQVKLLRVLQEQEFERLGSTRPTKVNVRVIAATNRDLEEEVARGRFRSDLFYRLNIFPIHLPPLRERKPDVPLLATHFAIDFGRRMGKAVRGIDAGAHGATDRVRVARQRSRAGQRPRAGGHPVRWAVHSRGTSRRPGPRPAGHRGIPDPGGNGAAAHPPRARADRRCAGRPAGRGETARDAAIHGLVAHEEAGNSERARTRELRTQATGYAEQREERSAHDSSPLSFLSSVIGLPFPSRADSSARLQISEHLRLSHHPVADGLGLLIANSLIAARLRD